MASNTSKILGKNILGDKVFTKIDHLTIMCNSCDCQLLVRTFSAKSTILAHEKSEKHCRKYSLWLKQLVQQELNDVSNGNFFFEKLTKSCVGLNIPFWRMNSPVFKDFFLEICNKHTPDESTIRKFYLEPLYNESLTKIIREIGDSLIYLQIDESTMHARRIVAVLVGKLDGQKPRSLLFNLVELNEPPNQVNIGQIILDSLHILWQGGLKYDKFRLLLTDQASYNLAASATLKTLFPKLYHVTCLCHALNRVSSLVQESYANVDLLVTKFCKVFGEKALQRIALLEDMVNEKIPSGPCQTRLGTWIKYCLFLNGKLDRIHEVLLLLNDPNIPGFDILLELVQSEEVQSDLLNIRDLKPIVDPISN